MLWCSVFGGRGTSGAIYRYDGSAFIRIIERDYGINCIDHTLDGTLWFGTSGRGIWRYDRTGFVNFTTDNGLTSNFIMRNPMRCSSDGTLWFGTLAGGVVAYDGVAWTSLDMRDGLSDDRVYSISEDAQGTLWFGTYNGLTAYNRSRTPPQVRILALFTDRTYTDFDALPPLTIGERVTMRYGALDFKTVPEKQQYRVSVGDADDAWQSPTKATEFDIAFDTPGAYTFSVQAIDRDLNYSEPASLTLEVIPDPRDQQIEELESELQRRNRELEAELQDAHDVQMSLMPEMSPEINGLEISGKCAPAREVSGDFFNYLESPKEGEIAIVVGDVTGHGMQGAMNAVMTDGVLHSVAKGQEILSPAQLMSDLNEVLEGRLEDHLNVTMVIGLINGVEKTLVLANAGHHAHPLLLRNGAVELLLAKGMPLGMIAGIGYREVECLLQSGDVVVFMTDGIIEAKDSSGTEYQDTRRLQQVLGSFTPDMTAEAMVSALITDATTFGAHMTPEEEDDITVVVVKVL